MKWERFYWFSLYAILGVYFLSTLFLQEPFLHPEAVMQAHWWNEKGFSFFNILFDTWKTDQHPGRFRFLVYFIEGAYWRLFKAHWVPEFFYDYVAILVNIGIAIFLYFWAQRKSLSHFASFALVAFFLLSAPVFMTSTWHCRKAKYLVSALFMAYLFLSEQPTRNRIRGATVAIAALGVLTDPYFILLFPLLILARAFERKSLTEPLSLVAGYAVAFVAVCFLNGIIGPWINPSTQLVFHHFEHIPDYYFNLASVPLFPYILLDMVGPLTLKSHPNGGFLLLVAGLIALTLLWLRSPRKPYFFLFFLVSLPIAAFMVQPKFVTARFGTYYGHPVFLFFLVGLVDVYLSTERIFPKVSRLSIVLLIPAIILHQLGKGPLFEGWRGGAFGAKEAARTSYFNDEALLNRLRRTDFEKVGPVFITLEGRDRYRPEWGYTYPTPDAPQLPHHDLGYLLIPLLFEKEIEEDRLVIQPAIN